MKLLDLFCGAGGSAMGYYRAGFTDIVGVDHLEQPNFPFTFVQADAPLFLQGLLSGGEIERFDLIHASPPCQRFTLASHVQAPPERHTDLLTPTRALLRQSGLPYVIENVPGAPLHSPLELCGSMFDLPLIRHRLFESRPPVWFPPGPHRCQHLTTASHRGKSSFANGATAITVAGHTYDFADGQQAMDIDWMTRDELSQAIPPAYTEFIGRQLRKVLRN